MTQYAYFRTQDNTIIEAQLRREDFTWDAIEENIDETRELSEQFGWELIGVFIDQWNDSKWEHEYARLERYGYYTRERQAELFDTVIVGTLDRLDV